MAELDDGILAWSEFERSLRERWPDPGPGASFTERRDHARRIADTLAGATADVPSPGCRITEVPVDADAPAGTARAPFARIYTPVENDGPLPTQLFLHGGGFCFGSARELVNDSVLTARTVATGIQHVSLEYALAPEHRFPVARDQTLRVFAELHERAEELSIDTSRLGLGGNSAGASIVASAALVLQRRPVDAGPRPHHLFLEVPAVSLQALGTALTDPAARDEPADRPAISPETEQQFPSEYHSVLELYRPARDGSAFVADAADLPPFPPALILAAEHDPLAGGAVLLAERLRRGGNAVRSQTVPGTFHGAPGITRTSPAAQEWQRIVDEELRIAYRTHPSVPVPDTPGV